MPRLRHFIIIDGGTLDGAYCLPDPLSEEEDMVVLENLQTLGVVSNLKFGEGVLKRIPNIKTLELNYERLVDTSEEDSSGEDAPRENSSREDASGEKDYYRLNNLCCLQKLETLRLCVGEEHTHMMLQVSFPRSLRKLTLEDTKLSWEDMKTKISWLPHLQVLKLIDNAFIGSEWETTKDQFLNLKFLLIHDCDVECWITDSTHFPRLEHLHLRYLKKLREIPSCIGDIPTLHTITVERCSDSVADSAEIIKEEQQENGNEDLQIIFR